ETQPSPYLSKSESSPSLSQSESSPSLSQSESLVEHTEDVAIQDVNTIVNDEPVEVVVKSSRKAMPGITKSRESLSETAPVCQEKTAHSAKTEQPPCKTVKPVVRHRSKSARHVMDIGKIDLNARYRHDLVAVRVGVDNSRLLSRLASRFESAETSNNLREVFPSKFTPERMVVPHQEKPGRDICHGKDCKRDNDIALRNIVKEFRNVHELLFQMKKKYAVQRVHESDSLIKNSSETASSNHVMVLKNLTNEMSKMAAEVDNGIGCVQKSARDLVDEFQDCFYKTKDKLTEDLKVQEKEIERLKQVNHELEYSMKEKDCNFESLEALVDNMNADNENLELRCKEMEGNNEKLVAENEKAKVELTFRVREINNLRCDVQRRDKCSSKLLDEYHTLWKERNTLNRQLTLLQSDLKVAEDQRTFIDTDNNELREQLEKLQKQVKELAGQVPEQDKELAGQVPEQVKEFAGHVPEQDKELAGQVPEQDKELAGQVPEQVKEFAGHVPEQDKELAGHVPEQDKELAGHVPEETSKEHESNATNGANVEFTRGFTIKTADSLLSLDPPANDSRSTKKDSKNIGLLEYVMFVNDGQVQNGLRKDALDRVKKQEVFQHEGCMAEGSESTAIPQEVTDRIVKLELAIRERNIQLLEFRDIVSSLKKRNTTLEFEKLVEINKYTSFRKETLEEAKELKALVERLQDKEKRLDELLQQNSNESDSSDDGVDWFEECVKVSRRVQEMEECMKRQYDILREIEMDRETLRNEYNKLIDSVSNVGVPHVLQDIENVVKQLQNDQLLTNGAPKAIRFYSDSSLAVKELQRIKKTTKNYAVFIVGDDFPTSSEGLASTETGKKKGKKLGRKIKIKDLIDTNGNNRAISDISEESDEAEDDNISAPLSQTPQEEYARPDE
ncbi:hypothetical protein QZH41_019800, partial [Actinostola sp. cb2023]